MEAVLGEVVTPGVVERKVVEAGAERGEQEGLQEEVKGAGPAGGGETGGSGHGGEGDQLCTWRASMPRMPRRRVRVVPLR